MKKQTTISINLRLPADLHKKLVEAAASASPPNSLNSEILVRLLESFDTAVQLEELEEKVRKAGDYATTQLREVQETAVARIREVESHADQLTERLERVLAATLELQRRATAKLKRRV
jgi:hypothetical protein